MLSEEKAIEEVTAWLDYKRIKQKTRDDNEEIITSLQHAFMQGDLELDSKTFELTQKLNFTLGNENSDVDKLVYKPRSNDKMLIPYMKGVKVGDVEGKITALTCALTKVPKALILEMDSTDKVLSNNICTFFFLR